MAKAGACPVGGNPTAEELRDYFARRGGNQDQVAHPIDAIVGVATAEQRVTDWTAGVLTLTDESVVVTSDNHVPRHDIETLKRVAQLGLAYSARTLVCAGDFLDFEELSTYPQPQDPGRPSDSVRSAVRILGAMLRVFERIVVIGGNHDVVRAVKSLDRARRSQGADGWLWKDLDPDVRDYETRYIDTLEEYAFDQLGKLCDRIIFRPETHLYIQPEEGGAKTLVTHQRCGGQNPPHELRKIQTRERCHVIGTHTHLIGYAKSDCGEFVRMNIGCGTAKEHHHYANRHDSGYPMFQRGCALVWRGVPELWDIDADPRRWAEVERVAARAVA